MSTTNSAATRGRNAAQGLRQLADLIEQHPELMPDWDRIQHAVMVPDLPSMIAIVRQLGGRWDKQELPGYFQLVRQFGDHVQLVVSTGREQACERVVVGTRTVKVPAEDAPMVEVEEEVVEWRCAPSLLAAARQNAREEAA